MTRLREHPTAPSDDMVEAVNEGRLWPRAFCAFKGCTWACMEGTEEDLDEHIRREHHAELQPIADQMLRGDAPDALLSIYNQAVAVVCRSSAPLAGCSIDRSALGSFAEACSGDNVESLVCFSCACIHTRVKGLAGAHKNDIERVEVLKADPKTKENLCFQQPVENIVDLLGLNNFLQDYDQLSEGRNITDHENFEHWTLSLPGPNGPSQKILCCPEDDKHTSKYGHICIHIGVQNNMLKLLCFVQPGPPLSYPARSSPTWTRSLSRMRSTSMPQLSRKAGTWTAPSLGLGQ